LYIAWSGSYESVKIRVKDEGGEGGGRINIITFTRKEGKGGWVRKIERKGEMSQNQGAVKRKEEKLKSNSEKSVEEREEEVWCLFSKIPICK
jgi:hypothetical protein